MMESFFVWWREYSKQAWRIARKQHTDIKFGIEERTQEVGVTKTNSVYFAVSTVNISLKICCSLEKINLRILNKFLKSSNLSFVG